eukprot:m.87802 g.87802  ORF g.87802 m.87802 type:complete len:305 (+) comp50994_c0_seq1:98-1012(+)
MAAQFDDERALKVLIPNYAAGAIIGKSGATISQLQADTGAHMKLSQNREFFPGTNERVMVLTGELSAVYAAVDSLIQRVNAVPEPTPLRAPTSESRAEPRSQQVKLVVPARSVGILIGKGGENIKALQASVSPAGVRISSKETELGTNERVVTISGTLAQLQSVSHRVLETLTSDPDLLNYEDLNPSYGQASESSPRSDYARAAPQSFHSDGSVPITITLPVADSLVGAILGKGGSSVHDIQLQSGAQISVSARGVFAPGTSNRTISITGRCKPLAAQPCSPLDLLHPFHADHVARTRHRQPRR